MNTKTRNILTAIVVLGITLGLTLNIANAQTLDKAGPIVSSFPIHVRPIASAPTVQMIGGSYGKVAFSDATHAFELTPNGLLYHTLTPAGGLGRGHWVATAGDLQASTACFPYGVPDFQVIALPGNIALFQTCDFTTGDVVIWQVGTSRDSLSVFLKVGDQITVSGQKTTYFGGPGSLAVMNGQPVVTGYFGNNLRSVLSAQATSKILADYGTAPFVMTTTASNGCMFAVTTTDLVSGQVQRTCANTTIPTTIGPSFSLGLDANYYMFARTFVLGSNSSRGFWLTKNQSGGLDFRTLGDVETTPSLAALGLSILNAPVNDLLGLVATDNTIAFGMVVSDHYPNTANGYGVGGVFTTTPTGQTNFWIKTDKGAVGLVVGGTQIYGFEGGGVSLGKYY